MTATVARAALVIAAATVLARLAGFARTLVFADAVKAGPVGNAYASANAVPNVVFEIAAGGILAAIVIPVVATHLGAGRRAQGHDITNAIGTWTLVVLVPLGLLTAATAPWLAGWLLAQHGPASVDLGTTMLRIFAPQIPLYGIGIVLTGLLHAHRRFLAAAVAPLLSSVVVIISYLAYARLVDDPLAVGSGVDPMAVTVLAGGTTAGVLALVLPLLAPAWATGWRPALRWRLPAADWRRVRGLAAGGTLALVAQQAATVATLWVTNHWAQEGAMNIYQYAQAVYVLPYAVLSVPIAMSTMPSLARHEGGLQSAAGSELLATALRATVVLMIGAAAVLVAAAPAVGAFFSGLDARRVGAARPVMADLPSTLTAYAPGVLGFSLIALLTRAVYVRGRPVLAGAAAASGWLVAAWLPVAVLGWWRAADRLGSPGSGDTMVVLGLACSLGMSLAAGALLVLVRKAWGPDVAAGLLRVGAACLVAAGVGAGLGLGMWHLVGLTSVVGAALTGAMAGGVALVGYVGVVSVADPESVRLARRALPRLGRIGGAA